MAAAAMVLLLFASTRATSPRPEAAERARVGSGAVFSPSPDFLADFHRACDAKSGADFGECFVAQMAKAGASREAVAFARSTGNLGYLRAFRETGRVDVGEVEYPFRANENQAWILVNGKPPVIDVGDTASIQNLLEANPVFKTLRLAHPQLAAFPRVSRDGPRALPAPDGGQRFATAYELKDCRACKAAGYASVAFRFDAGGVFLGPELGQVKPYYH